MPKYHSFSDEELFVMLGHDDHDAYTEIYHRYSGLLYVHAYRRIRSREEAKDLIHELFTAIWIKRREIALSTSLSAYLYRAVKNRVIDQVIRRKREITYIDSLQQRSLENNATDYDIRQKDLQQLIEKEIDALPEKMQLVFKMSRNDHMSHKEIANELSLSELTVRKQVSNALKVLKPKLSKLLFFSLF